MSDQVNETVTENVRGRALGIAGYVQALPAGERAEIRRSRRGRTPGGVFWRIVERYGINPTEEPFWEVVLPLMANHKHRNGSRLGCQLRSAGVSERRFERWLNQDRAEALGSTGRILSLLQDTGVNWADLGALLWFWTEPSKRWVARDYYLGKNNDNQKEQSDAKG